MKQELNLKTAMIAVLVTMLTVFSVGCAKEEGPMEKMGKQMDEAVEKAVELAGSAA